MRLRFTKMSGAGNDFIVLDGSTGIPSDRLPELARLLCPRRTSVGADGLLVLERGGRGDCTVDYYNADGSPAAMCGNGARCAARKAKDLGWATEELILDMGGALCRAVVGNDSVSVELPSPERLQMGLHLEVAGVKMSAHLTRVGVPHVVVPVGSVEEIPVEEWGRHIRQHDAFAPEGANVDFVVLDDADPLPIRTYERGVEGETLACGTGCGAAAMVAFWEKGHPSPVALKTWGGDVLRVHFRPVGSAVRELFLEGDARVVYAGEVDLTPRWGE